LLYAKQRYRVVSWHKTCVPISFVKNNNETKYEVIW